MKNLAFGAVIACAISLPCAFGMWVVTVVLWLALLAYAVATEVEDRVHARRGGAS